MDAQARRFDDRAQIGDGRAFAVGAGNVNDGGKLVLGVAEPLQQPVGPFETELDLFGMKHREPRDQFVQRRRRCCRRWTHAWGAAAAISTTGTIWAAAATCGAGFEGASSAGDLVRSRQRRASVGRNSCRCTTMSTMP